MIDTEEMRKKHQFALRDFDNIYSVCQEEREMALNDRRFYSIPGAQWEGDLEDQFANKPKYEVNKIHQSVISIINEYRNNRITVDFVDDDEADQTDLSDLCDDLFRADEQRSSAEEAYDNAFEESVGGGIGAWRLINEYVDPEDPEDDRQKIAMEPIYEADTRVFFNLGAKTQSKRDAKRCYLLTPLPRKEYIEEWGDDPVGWPYDIVNDYQFDWATPDVVYIVEYYEVELKKVTYHVFENLDGTEQRYTQKELDETTESGFSLQYKLEKLGARKVRQKKVTERRIRKLIMSGGGVLEDCGYVAGSYIPVIITYGKRWYVDNVERSQGHGRLAKDVQRLKNIQLSKLGEISALSPVEKPIFLPEQVIGHKDMWAEDNVKNFPYVLVNAIEDANGQKLPAGPVGYTKPAVIPPAMAALLQITEEDMKDLLGSQQEGEQLQGNISTETAMLFQNRIDMRTFIFMSNFAKAIKHSGAVWLSMAKELYIEPNRKMRAVASSGESRQVMLNTPATISEGTESYDNDLSAAKFGVYVDVGPSSTTRRESTLRALINMAKMTEDPETKQVLGLMAATNMQGEGVSDAREYFRKKLIRMGVVKPNEKEAEELQAEQQNAKPTPQDEYLQAAAANEQSKAVKGQADTILTQAKADQTRAETAKTIAEIDEMQGKLSLEAIEKLGPRVQPPDIPGSDIEGN